MMTSLEKLVRNFRAAIECAQANGEPAEFFRRFPAGQCRSTSDMLAQYLNDKGVDDVQHVWGIYYGNDSDNGQSHAWLMVGDLVIDLTCDQFRNHNTPLKCNIPVVIAPTPPYYQLFTIPTGAKYHQKGLSKEWVNYYELKECYETILKYIVE